MRALAGRRITSYSQRLSVNSDVLLNHRSPLEASLATKSIFCHWRELRSVPLQPLQRLQFSCAYVLCNKWQKHSSGHSRKTQPLQPGVEFQVSSLAWDLGKAAYTPSAEESGRQCPECPLRYGKWGKFSARIYYSCFDSLREHCQGPSRQRTGRRQSTTSHH